MTELFTIYALACIAIALVVHFGVFYPALKYAVDTGVDNPLTRNVKLTIVTHFIVATIVAPLWVLASIDSTWMLAATQGLRNEVSRPND